MARKKDEVEAVLKSALPLAQQENQTVTWYAFTEDEGSYGIFDTFETEEARTAHLTGRVPAALAEVSGELLASAPVIRPVDLLAVK